MGDNPSDRDAHPPEYASGAYVRDDAQITPKASGSQHVDASGPFYSQYSNIPPQQRVDLSRLQTGAAAYNVPSTQGQGAPSFNMGSMMGALPDYASSGQGQRGSSASGTPQSAGFRGQQMPQYPYGVGQFQGGMAHEDMGRGTMGQPGQRGPDVHQAFSPYGQQVPQYYYTGSPFTPQSAQQAFFPGAPFDRRTSLGTAHAPQSALPGAQVQIPGVSRPMPGFPDPYGASFIPSAVEGTQRSSSGGGAGSVPRGPPRKPKQSGHALWVGNLPPGTTVIDLKDHFSRDATKDIESLFLISKSNCAFVNYRTEASCAAAMQRFHDSRFHGVRLVCRLRRGSAAPPGTPTGPSSLTGSSTTAVETSAPSSPRAPEVPTKPVEVDGEAPVKQDAPATTARVPDRYFVVKSLTLEDLELSVRNGIWATQAHNEETLNKAYESADNVYLIFSANKSGEYFGYGRMASAITEDATQLLGTIQRHEPTEAVDAPRTIPTAATETAPRGHIIDDSARGTIFWEADHSDEEEAEEPKESAEPQLEPDGSGGQQAWGKPFKLEWISTHRLPFYRTRGLRNPWNANREVKIARDGTELEPSVGNRLIQMFHRMGQPAGPVGQLPGVAQIQMPPPQIGGGPHMRPY